MSESLPAWIPYLVQGLTLFVQMVLATVVLSKAGRSPYWALASVVPLFYVPVIALWAFAFTPWPRVREAFKEPRMDANGRE